jgi:hypothetical protein
MLAQPELLWTLPRLPSADFTPEDPLAIDYLGQQVGNWLWPGFTTRTSRTGYYVMVVYGLKLAEELIERHGLPRTDATVRLIFERWEKLWALAICASYDGEVPGEDGLRGLRGTQRYFEEARGGEFHLDFRLLARQLELGALGAYLTSLRRHGLVAENRLRPSPLGAQLADRMWGGPGSVHNASHQFVLENLARDARTVQQQVGRVTLTSLGERARLSRLASRQDVQQLLWRQLFISHPPPADLALLPVMAECLVAAHADGVHQPRPFLEGLLAERWGPLDSSLKEVIAIAMNYGDLSSHLRSAFDRAYRAVVDGGLQAPFAEVAARAFPDEYREETSRVVETWRGNQEAQRRFAALSTHGAGFVACLRSMAVRDPESALTSLLDLHLRVQRDRGHRSGWLRHDGTLVLLEMAGYRRWSLDPAQWVVGYKHGAMVQILRDLGRIS